MPESLLFLAHRIPYPPDKGDKIRSFHLLRHLSTRYAVHLGAFVDDPDDWRHAEALGQWCASVKLVGLSPLRARLRSLMGLVRGEALTLPYYRSAELAGWVDETVRAHRVRLGLAYSSAMAQYLPATLIRRVLDMVDVDSDKWSQYAPTRPWPLSWIYAREGRLLARWEARAGQASTSTVLVSEAEAALFRSRAPEVAERVQAFENGVDADYFSPDRDYPDPYAGHRQTLVFTGAMDYWPNVDAVNWFAREILPRVQARCPQARFTIVGSRPSEAVQALTVLPGVAVTGRVPDVRPYLAHAACAVAPLRIARGVQNKVLEAMAMACPVVASPAAAEGLRAMPGRDFTLAEHPDGLADAVCDHLTRPARNPAGRTAVRTHYDWATNLARIDVLLDPAPHPEPTS